MDPFYDNLNGLWDHPVYTYDGVSDVVLNTDPCYLAVLERRTLRAWRPLRHHVAGLARRVYAAVLHCATRRQ